MQRALQKQNKLLTLRQSLATELDDLFLFTSNLSRRAYFSSERANSGGGLFGIGGGQDTKPKDNTPLPRHLQRIVTKRGNPPLSLRKKLDAPNVTPEYISLQSVFSVKKKTYSRLQDFMSRRMKTFKKEINQKNKRLSQILPYAKESILKVNKVEGGTDKLEISLWNPSLYSTKSFQQQGTQNMATTGLGNQNSMNLGNKGFSEDTPEWNLSIDNFKEECEQKFGWVQGNEDSRKNGKCMIEIISNIGKIKIMRINCERLLSKTRYVRDCGDEEWDKMQDPNFEQVKITEYLLKLSNLKLFEAVSKEKLKKDTKLGLSGDFNSDNKRIELFKKGKKIQVSLVREGEETVITNREYKSCVSFNP